jgi:hypothetical protein
MIDYKIEECVNKNILKQQKASPSSSSKCQDVSTDDVWKYTHD